MTEDHEARKMASLALSRIEQHEKHCEERARKAEIFEAEMRAGVRDIAASFRDGLNRIHSRLDSFQKAALISLSTGVLGFLATAVWWLITNPTP
jgi:hypothetical protein